LRGLIQDVLDQLLGLVDAEFFVFEGFLVAAERADLETADRRLTACTSLRLSTDDLQEPAGLSFLFLLFMQGTTPSTRRS